MPDFKVEVAELLGKPGRHHDVVISKTLPPWGMPLARLGESPTTAHLRAESVVEGILVTGSVVAPVHISCARCLAEVETRVDVEVCELFEAGERDRPAHEDAYPITDRELDLEPMLRDAITLALPLNPVCDEACKGMCSSCGANLNEGPCDCSEEEFDPRWAGLDALRMRLEDAPGELDSTASGR